MASEHIARLAEGCDKVEDDRLLIKERERGSRFPCKNSVADASDVLKRENPPASKSPRGGICVVQRAEYRARGSHFSSPRVWKWSAIFQLRNSSLLAWFPSVSCRERELSANRCAERFIRSKQAAVDFLPSLIPIRQPRPGLGVKKQCPT